MRGYVCVDDGSVWVKDEPPEYKDIDAYLHGRVIGSRIGDWELELYRWGCEADAGYVRQIWRHTQDGRKVTHSLAAPKQGWPKTPFGCPVRTWGWQGAGG